MTIATQVARDWNVVVADAELRKQIMRNALAKLNKRAASGAIRESHPPTPPKWGFEGVDKPTRRRRDGTVCEGRTFRARISLWDCANGEWIRLSRRGFASAEEAGYWYACTHVAFWGRLSRYAGEMTVEDYEVLVGITRKDDTTDETDQTDAIEQPVAIG